MRKKLKMALCFTFCLIFSFFILLYGVTVYRENSYDNKVQSFLLPEERKYVQMDNSREYWRDSIENYTVKPPLDDIFNDPVLIDYMVETHAIATEYEFGLSYDLIPRICEREPTVFPLRFFHVYGKLYSFENLRHVILVGIVDAYDLGPFYGDSVFDDMGAAIYAWESEGNVREGEWLNTFLASPQYETFLQDLYVKIESLEEESLENMMEDIRDAPIESHGFLSELKTPFLKDAQKLAPVLYEGYQKDKQQGDISRVPFEARILQTLHQRVQWFEGYTPYQCRNLRWARPFLPDPFVDLAGILVSSVIISLVATYFVNKKYWT